MIMVLAAAGSDAKWCLVHFPATRVRVQVLWFCPVRKWVSCTLHHDVGGEALMNDMTAVRENQPSYGKLYRYCVL